MKAWIIVAMLIVTVFAFASASPPAQSDHRSEEEPCRSEETHADSLLLTLRYFPSRPPGASHLFCVWSDGQMVWIDPTRQFRGHVKPYTLRRIKEIRDVAASIPLRGPFAPPSSDWYDLTMRDPEEGVEVSILWSGSADYTPGNDEVREHFYVIWLEVLQVATQELARAEQPLMPDDEVFARVERAFPRYARFAR